MNRSWWHSCSSLRTLVLLKIHFSKQSLKPYISFCIEKTSVSSYHSKIESLCFFLNCKAIISFFLPSPTTRSSASHFLAKLSWLFFCFCTIQPFLPCAFTLAVHYAWNAVCLGSWLTCYLHGAVFQPSICMNLQLLPVTSFCFLLLLALTTVRNYLFWLLISFLSLLLLGCIRSTESLIFLDYLLW